ncbi:DNA-binding protein [Pengzhenrongella frigida]|uniref:DNA-binding protein n=1 Tax=Pengzhenrongella frigida TaxID=1259133 RepID=A0A4Q5N1J6_9MICO|nr:DNA-binding protein [Cellulomonas sp. HLT2-17]RYV52052.1 DNA-binding protein [Cellulomonas sp. HLT2-17]
MGDLVTVQETAIWLRETERSVRRRIAGGQLTAYRLGTKRILLARSDVEALLVLIPTAA